MKKQELIQKSVQIMNKHYCNGVTINRDTIVEDESQIRFYLDFLIPKRIIENETEHTFFIKLKNVGLIKLSKDGGIISVSKPEEFVNETIEKYKELFEKREKFIVKLFADRLVKIEQIHLSLTPLRKVLRKFKEKDYLVDNLKRNFEEKEIKYITFLNSLGYLRKEGGKYTLDNEYIKKLSPKINKSTKEKEIEGIIGSIFAEHFTYIINELNNSSIVPFIGIAVTFCNLVLELEKNIKLSMMNLYDLYLEHYMSGQDQYSFEDKIIDMDKSGIFKYDESKKTISLPSELFEELISSFKARFKQYQLS
nr:hypothetical protein [Candidatus Woesearchaeota archaeon]